MLVAGIQQISKPIFTLILPKEKSVFLKKLFLEKLDYFNILLARVLVDLKRANPQ